jgi:hypothetical protein
MTTVQQRCPCGSGKPLGRCCTEKQLAHRKIRLILTSVLCVIVAGGLGALAFSMTPERPKPAAVVGATTPTVLPSKSNKHYHPGHAHWHTGPPPPEDQRNAATTTTTSSPFSTSTTVTPGN